jgi:superfamily II DNA or RNA helicase
MTYQDFLKRKLISARPAGLESIPELSPALFPFQRRVVERALSAGRYALFLDTGLGKTICQLEWAKHVPGEVLILAPVAVAPQTVREGREKLGLDIHHSRDGSVRGKVTITNYERLHLFDPARFTGVVLDESSILKSFMGKTKTHLCHAFQGTPYRLSCTATPAPNDYMELGNQSEFLGVMPSNEMLSRWFINDTMSFGSYRLKGHAIKPFWEWVASWAAVVSKPSDAGGDDAPFKLPELTTKVHVVESPMRTDLDRGLLFAAAELSATDMHRDKRNTMQERVRMTASLADHSDYCLIWCESNEESEAIAKAVHGSVEVQGSDSPDDKEAKLDAFSRGEVRAMVTKPSLAGFGLNWQHCNHVIFASLSFSYENFYQAIRRSWRFGQKRPVRVDVVIADTESTIWSAVKDKLSRHDEMKSAMRFARPTWGEKTTIKLPYLPTHKTTLPSWIKTL